MHIYLKFQFCLGPIANYKHLRQESTEFYEFDDMQIYQFLDVLDISSLNYDQNTLGYCFSER